jgi:hypothetical protein
MPTPHLGRSVQKAAANFARLAKLFDEIIEIFHEADAVDKLYSNVNRQAPAGGQRLLGPELYARNLTAFSRTQPQQSKVTKLPNVEYSDLDAWPPRPTAFVHTFATTDGHQHDQ